MSSAKSSASEKGDFKTVKDLEEKFDRGDFKKKQHLEIPKKYSGSKRIPRHNSNVTPVEQILFSACYEGEHPTVHALISHNCEVNCRTKTGATPLYMAAEQGHIRCVKELLAAGADVNLGIKSSATPIYIASQNGHLKVVEALIQANADINIRKKNGTTPLFVASRKGHVRVIEALVCAGADVELCTQGGQTALKVAEKYEQTEAIAYLKEVLEAMRRAQIAQARLKEEEDRRERGEHKDYQSVKKGRSPDQVFNGTCTWFDSSRGYGYVQLDSGRSFFVHASEIKSDTKPLLEKGQNVNFKIIGRGDAKRAVDVTPIDNVQLNSIASKLVVCVKSGSKLKKVGVFSEDSPSPYCTVVPFTVHNDALDDKRKKTGVQKLTCVPKWDDELIWEDLRNINRVEVNLYHSRKFMWDRFIGRVNVELPFDDIVQVVTLSGKKAGELGELEIHAYTK